MATKGRRLSPTLMSAYGPMQTCRKTQSISLLGVKRTCLFLRRVCFFYAVDGAPSAASKCLSQSFVCHSGQASIRLDKFAILLKSAAILLFCQASVKIGLAAFVDCGQRTHKRLKRITSSVWLELDLQSTLSAIEKYTSFIQSGIVKSDGDALPLSEGADAANMVARQSFGIHRTHHSCSLAVKCGGQLFHTDFAIEGHDDTHRLAIDFGHKRLQEAPRLNPQTFGSLNANAFSGRIIIVAMEAEVYTEIVQKSCSTCAL